MERNNPMTSDPQWDAAAVEQAISQVTSMRPAYATIIGFYGAVFVAQVEAAVNTSPETIQIDESSGNENQGGFFAGRTVGISRWTSRRLKNCWPNLRGLRCSPVKNWVCR
jgi:hypothetical protein